MRRRLEEAIRQGALNLPEDTKRRLQWLAEFHRSDAWKSYWSATKAAMDGDEAPIHQWARARTGVKPDSVLRVHLLKARIGDLSPAETWTLVAARSGRLRRDAKARAVIGRRRLTRRGISKKYPSVRLAIEELTAQGERPEDDGVLLERIPGLSYEKDSVTLVANQIRREAFEQPRAPRRVIGHGPESLVPIADRRLLAEFELREELLAALELDELRAWVEAAGFSELEAEVHSHDMQTEHDTKAIARALGLKPGTVRVIRGRYTRKLRKAAGL